MVTDETLHNPCGGHLSLDFTNSTGRGPEGTENERLVDYPALLRWSLEAGTLLRGQARTLERRAGEHPRSARAVLARAISLREAVFDVFHADVNGARPPRDALGTINAELAKALPHARVEPGSQGFAWTWSNVPADLDAPLWPIARAAADLLVSPDRELVKECASERCLWLFLDRSRNHGRRWCEMKSCGNLAKVRRHRRRYSKGRGKGA